MSLLEPTVRELQEAVEMPDILPQAEQKRLAFLEDIIRTDMAAFLRVGAALAEIRDTELYRGDALTFELYLKIKWDMSRGQGYRLVNAHTVVKQLELQTKEQCLQIGDTQHAENIDIAKVIPNTESQIRPLTRFKDQPELLAEIWNKAVADSPSGKITAKRIQETIFSVTGQRAARKEAGNKEKAAKAPWPKSYSAALQGLNDEISRIRAGRYKEMSRAEIVNSLEAVIEVLQAEVGAA